MDRIVLYHNPACGKSRATLDILRARGLAFDLVEYLNTPLTEAALRAMLDELDEPPAALVRNDGNFRKLALDAADYTTADAVVGLLLAHPELMQRPVVARGGRAVIARPPEKLEALL